MCSSDLELPREPRYAFHALRVLATEFNRGNYQPPLSIWAAGIGSNGILKSMRQAVPGEDQLQRRSRDLLPLIETHSQGQLPARGLPERLRWSTGHAWESAILGSVYARYEALQDCPLCPRRSLKEWQASTVGAEHIALRSKEVERAEGSGPNRT